MHDINTTFMDKSLWLETTATIYTCGWKDTPWYYLGSGNYVIVCSYEIDGHQYSAEYDDFSPATEGSQFPLRYNPDNPEENEKSVKMKHERWLTIGGPALLLVGSILYWRYRR
jgi:hypothetical protein